MPTPASGQLDSRRIDRVVRRGARALVVATTVLALGLSARALTGADWPDPEPRLTTRSTAASRSVLGDLDRQGVRLDGEQRRALRALLAEWQRRPEMRRTMALRDGTPDLRRLLSWAAGTTDPSASLLADFRGDLLEVQYRMGILDGTGNIIPVLRWALRNRSHPVILANNAILRMAQVWNSRQDVVDQFLIDGRVDARGFIWWCANVPKGDPAEPLLYPVAGDLQRLTAELPPRSLGRNW